MKTSIIILIGFQILILSSACNSRSSKAHQTNEVEPKQDSRIRLTLDQMTDDSVVVKGARMNSAEFSEYTNMLASSVNLPVDLHYYSDKPLSDEERTRKLATLRKWRQISNARSAYMIDPRENH